MFIEGTEGTGSLSPLQTGKGGVDLCSSHRGGGWDCSSDGGDIAFLIRGDGGEEVGDVRSGGCGRRHARVGEGR